jgi:hypothetical protein
MSGGRRRSCTAPSRPLAATVIPGRAPASRSASTLLTMVLPFEIVHEEARSVPHVADETGCWRQWSVIIIWPRCTRTVRQHDDQGDEAIVGVFDQALARMTMVISLPNVAGSAS